MRNVLLRDSYTGRTVYRRLKRVRFKNGKTHSHVVQRPSDEWIEIEGATPPIIDRATWEHVQEIIEDPERISRKSAGRYYEFASRVRCDYAARRW